MSRFYLRIYLVMFVDRINGDTDERFLISFREYLKTHKPEDNQKHTIQKKKLNTLTQMKNILFEVFE